MQENESKGDIERKIKRGWERDCVILRERDRINVRDRANVRYRANVREGRRGHRRKRGRMREWERYWEILRAREIEQMLGKERAEKGTWPDIYLNKDEMSRSGLWNYFNWIEFDIYTVYV